MVPVAELHRSAKAFWKLDVIKSSQCGPFIRQPLPTHTIVTPPVACFLEELSLRDNKRRILQVFFCLSSWQLIWYESAHPWWYFQSKHRDEPEIVFTIHLSYVFCVPSLLESTSEIGFSPFVYLQKQLLCAIRPCASSNLKTFFRLRCCYNRNELNSDSFFFSTKSESFARRCVQSLRFAHASWNINDFKRRPLGFQAKALIIFD